MANQSKYSEKAFTLIELLVVIAIIALLLAILMPSLGKAKQLAQSVVCKTNLRQWNLVFRMYTDDNNGSFNQGWAGTGPKSNWWMDAGRVYYSDVDKVRCCPSATQPRTTETGAVGPGRGKEPNAAWTIGSNDDGYDYGSYGTNGWTENKPDNWTTAANRPKFWRKLPNITNASNVPIILDMQWIDTWPEPDNPPPPERDTYWSFSHFARVVQDRHDEKQNCAFADGSVATVGLKQLWILKWHREYNTAGPWTLGGGATSAKWPKWMRNFKDY